MTLSPRRWIIAAVHAGALALVASGALAADDAPSAAALRLRSLAATCAACHGTDGRAPEGATLPGLAGLAGVPKDTLVEQLKAFKSGARPGTVMPQIAKGYSDAQIEQLAAWFSKAGK